MTAYVIADLHLSAEAPELTDAFRKFADTVSGDDELYIVGDLFNYYVGINPENPAHKAVREVNSSICSRGGRVYFIHGNRDFLLNRKDAHFFRMVLLNDVHQLVFGDMRILMVHGDELCDETVGYRCFRLFSRLSCVQCMFNTLFSYRHRIGMAQKMRAKSIKKFEAANYVRRMINPVKTLSFMKKYGVSVLIHGHTHNAEELRPDDRYLIVDTGDWTSSGFSFVKIEYGNATPGNNVVISLERRKISGR